MYIPQDFFEDSTEVLVDLIEKKALGCLIMCVEGGIEANHLPFLYEKDEHLMFAHIAKQNPLYSLLKTPQEVLIVFEIDHAYVSPNWYAGKFEHHRTVPTWNYVVIHVKGVAQIIDDRKKIRGILAKLTRKHEATQAIPWKITDAPADYIEDEMNQIVGIQIEIKQLYGKFKLSQNRSVEDAENVAKAFSKQGQAKMSELMLEQLKLRI